MSTNFPGSLDSYSTKNGATWVDDSHVNDPQDALEACQAKLGIGNYADNLHSLVYNFFASGRKMWIYNSVPPTGWSTVAIGDRVLAVKGGATYTTGGATAQGASFDTIEAHVHANPHTHTLGNHRHWLYDYRGNTTAYGWHVGVGTATAVLTAIAAGAFQANVVGWQTSRFMYPDIYCINAGAQTSNSTSPANLVASNISEARPNASIGLVITKT